MRGFGALLFLGVFLQAATPASGTGRQTGQAEIGEPSSTLLLAHEQVPYRRHSRKSRPDMDSELPMLTGGDSVFPASARYGADSQQSYESVYEMHPFLGSARGGTEVRFVFHDVFPGGISVIYCRFGGHLAEPLSWGYKKWVGAMEVMCLAPPGVANTHVKAGISLNGVEFFPGGKGSQLFYYYREPVVTAVMPQTGDIRGGTRVSFFLSEDVLGNALGSIPKEKFTEALYAVQCMFDKTIVPSEGVHLCTPAQSAGSPVPCVVCISPPAEQREVGQVQVKLALNTINWAPKRAPFVYMDYYPVQTARSEFGYRSLHDALEPNQRFVDEDGSQINPEDIPMLESALSEFYGQFYGAVDTMTQENPPDYQFYDGMYSFYSTGALGTDRAEVCVTAIKPSTGPAAGGTTLSIRAQGTIPFGHSDFYCVFHNRGSIVKASETEYDSAEDAVVLTCDTPPGEPVSTEYVGISLDGISVSPLGVPFYYHGPIDLSLLTPSEGPSHGGTALTVTLTTYEPLPASADASAVYTTCKFSHISISGVETEEVVEGVYTPAAGAVFPTVGCLMPGLPVDTVPSGNVSVTVSLNGLDYADTALTFTALRFSVVEEQVPMMDLYGLQISPGAPGETTYPEQELLEPAALLGLAYTELPYSLARCLSYPRTSIATLSELKVAGDIVLPDFNVTAFVAEVEPEFSPGVLAYTTEVPYQMYNGFSLQGVTTDSFANMFVRGQVVPRGERSVVTAHDLDAGVTSAELTVLSSDATSSLTYTVTVARGPAGTEDRVAAVNITGALPGETEVSPMWDEAIYTGYTARVRFLYSEYLLFEPVLVDPYSRAIVTSNETVGSETVGFNQPTTAANLSLPIGFSVVTVTGVSEGGVASAVSIYEILVERVAPQSVSTLEDMIITSLFPDVGGAVLTPSVWAASVTSYTLSLLFEEDTLLFKPVPTDEVQLITVTPDGGPGTVIPYDTEYNLTSIPTGSSMLTFTSVGEDLLNTTVYTITLQRATKSSDATLANIFTESCGDVTQGQLAPNFTASTFSYDVTVSHQCELDPLADRIIGVRTNVQDITVTPFCTDFFCSLISVTFPDGTVATGPNGTIFTIPLPITSVSGITVDTESQVPITVTAEDGVTNATYNLKITRLARSSISGLLNMTVDGSFSPQFSTSGVLYQSTDLTEGFDPSVYKYFMEVESGVSTVSVSGSNSQLFSVTAVELNPPTAATSATAVVLTNGTTLTMSGLTAGVNNTLRVRVHAEKYQPERKFEYYSPLSYTDYTITVFRRTVSGDPSLANVELVVGSVGRIPTTIVGTPLAITPNFTSLFTSYTSSTSFSVSGVTVTPTLPATSGSVSVLDNVNRGSITVGGGATDSGSPSAVQSLDVGFNSVSIVVTAEDGVTTRTYQLNVTRGEPNLDTSLVSLIPATGWIVADGQTGENGTETDPTADFSPDTVRYTIRGIHPFQYLSAVLPNERSSISFTPVANASVNGVPAVSITINGQEVANGTESPAIVLPDSTFPVPASTVVNVVVYSEDFSINKTYAITVTRAPGVPDPSFWIQFYRLVGGPGGSTVEAPLGATINTWITTDDLVPATLEIDPDLWNATFSPSIPDLAADYSPVSELVFQPMYSVDGGAYEAYGDPYTLGANSTTKSLDMLLFGGRNGELTVKVMAYELDVNGTFVYGTVHGLMSLGHSVMEGPNVMGPGVAEYLLTPYDSYGNLINDDVRVYSPSQLSAYVCPNATTCDTPGAGQASVRADFKYNVFYSMSTNGLNFLHLEGRYSSPTPPIPWPDILAGSPIGVTVQGNALGSRSFVETIPYRSWVVVQDPAYFFIHARDDFGNDILEGGQADQLQVTTDPPLVNADGNEIPPVVEDVSEAGQRAKYRVTLPSTASGELRVTVRIAGGFIIVDGVFRLTVLPGDFSPEKTPISYPVDVVAGGETEMLITATDAFGNVLEFDDFSDYLIVEIFQLTGVRRRGLAQLINRVKLPIDVAISKRNTVYSATFTAPTDASVTYGLLVLAFSFPGKETVLPVTEEPEPFSVLPGLPTAANSLYVVPSQAAAGELKLGVKGADQFDNLAVDGAWLANASSVLGGGVVVEAGLSGQSLSSSDSNMQAIDLGSAGLTAAGIYSVRMFIRGEEVVNSGLPATVSIVPGPISSRSSVTSVPSQVTIGTTVSIYISAVDRHGNAITSGGESTLISPYVSNVADAVDSFDAVVTDNGGGAYTISFSPSKTGTFSVAIRFSGELKQPVPEFLSIVQSTTPEDYVVTTTASLRPDTVYELDIQQSVTFTITPNADVPTVLISRSVVTATLVFLGTGAAETLAVTAPSSTGVRTVTFSKEVSGQYRLELLVEGQPLVGSPFPLEVVAGTPVVYYVEELSTVAFVAGESVVVYVHVLDILGNTVAVDTATELAVAFEQQPGGELTYGAMEANLVSGFPEGNGAGYRGTSTLTISAIYRLSVTLNVGGVVRSLCRSGVPAGTTNCLPELSVSPSAAFAPASQLTGSGTSSFLVGDTVSLTVYSLDGYDNSVARSYAAAALAYTAEVTGPAGLDEPDTQELVLVYSPDDNTHQLTYTLTSAGDYQLQVIKTAPRDEPEALLVGEEFPYTVGGAPVSLTVSAGAAVADNTEIEELVGEAVVGRDNSLFFSMRDFYDNVVTANLLSSLKVIINGPATTLTTVGASGGATLRYESGGRYAVTYRTAFAGSYTANVYLNDVPSASIDLEVLAGPASPASSAIGSGLFTATAGTASSFMLLAADTYGNQRRRLSDTGASPFLITMTLTQRSTGNTLSTSAITVPPGNITTLWSAADAGYRVQYLVGLAGLLSISVRVGGVHITSSPFVAQVLAGPTSSAHSTIEGLGLKGTVLGRPAALTIRARDANGNLKSSGGDPFRVSLRCVSVSTCSGAAATASILDNDDGTYSVTYSSSAAGEYSLELTLRNAQVGVIPARSPLSIIVLAAAGPISYRSTVARGVGLAEARAGQQATFTIIAADALGIQLSTGGARFVVELAEFLDSDGVVATGPVTELSSRVAGQPNSVVDNLDGTYTVSYTVTAATQFALMVWADAAKTTTIAVPPTATGWPVTVNVFPGFTDPATCLLDPTTPLPTRAQAGQAISTRVLAFDSYGNRQRYVAGVQAGDEFSIVATATGAPTASGTSSQSADARGYDLRLVIDSLGSYQVSIRLRDPLTGALTAIGTGETFGIVVVAGGISGPRSLASGTGLSGGLAGANLPISVLVNDGGGNPVVVAGLPSSTCVSRLRPANGPNQGCTMGGASVGPSTGICDCVNVQCTLDPNSSSRYRLNARTPCADTYTLSISLNATAVASSPFRITVAPEATSASASRPSGPGLTSASAGQSTAFVITAADGFGNRRTTGGDVFVAWMQHSGGQPDVFASVADLGTGEYSVSYTPVVIGSHSLNVQLNGQAISGSPYTVSVGVSATAASQSYIIMPPSGSTEVVAGEETEMTVVAISSTGVRQDGGPTDEFEVTLLPDANGFGSVATPVAERTAARESTYRLRFSAERVVYSADGEPSPYLLSVTLDGEHIKGSPMEVFVSPGPVGARRSQLFDSGSDLSVDTDVSEFGAVAGQRRDLLLQLRDIFGNDAAYNPFSELADVGMRVAGAETDPATAGEDISDTVQVVDTRDARFRVSYRALVAGSYVLRPLVNGAVIGDGLGLPALVVPGPFDLKSFSLRGPGITTPAAAGIAYYFVIEPRDAYGNFRADDGRLVCFTGNVIYPGVDPDLCPPDLLEIRMYVRTGGRLSGFQREEVEVAELIFEPKAGAGETGLPWQRGMYRAEFEARMEGELVTELALGDEVVGPYYAPITAAAVVPSSITLGGAGAQGTALSAGGAPSEPVAVHIEPRDSYGNLASSTSDATVELTATFIDPLLGVLDGVLTVSEVEWNEALGVYVFTYAATTTGSVRLEISYNGVAIGNGEPVLLPVYQQFGAIDPAFTFLEGPALDGVIAGERTYVNVVLRSTSQLANCFQDSMGEPLAAIIKLQRGCEGLPYPLSAGDGFVTAELNFEEVTSITDQGNGTYTIYFTLQESGNHALTVLLGPQPENPQIGTVLTGIGLGDSVNLLAHPSITTQASVSFTDITGQGQPAGSLVTFYSGQPLRVIISPQDMFGNLQSYVAAPLDEFRVDVLFNGFQSIPVDYLEQRSTSSLVAASVFFEAQLTLNVTGEYLVDVFFRGDATGGEWISVTTSTRVTLLPGLPSVAETEIAGEGLRVSPAGSPAQLRITLLDAGGNALGDGLTQRSLVEALILSGSYEVDTDPVITPEPAPPTTPAPSLPPTTPPPSTDPGSVPAPPAPGDPTGTPSPGDDSPIPTVDAMTATPAAPDGQPTPTPMVTSEPQTGMPTDTPTATPDAAAARRRLAQTVDVPPVVTAVLVSSTGQVPVSVVYDPIQHYYRGEYITFTAGRYFLDVRLYGKRLNIPNYQFTAVLAGAEHTPSCTVSGTGAGDAGPLPAGEMAEFTVQAVDANGNRLSRGGANWAVLLESATDTDNTLSGESWVADGSHFLRASSVTDLQNGRYRVAYRPLVAATYLLSVRRGGVHVSGSPFVVDVRAGPTVAAQSVLTCDDAVEGACGLTELPAGNQGVFYIQAKDRFGGNKTTSDDQFFYSIVGSGGYSKDSVTVARGQAFPGQYRATFNTEKAGPLTVTVTLRGTLVGQVMTAIIPGRVDAQRCTLSSAAFPTAPVWTPGQEPDVITITARDTFGNALTEGGLTFDVVMAKTDASYSVTLSVTDQGDGTYQSTYINKEPGEYRVTGRLGLESLPTQSLSLRAGPAVVAHTEVVSSSGVSGTLGTAFRAGSSAVLWLRFKDTWLNTRVVADTYAALGGASLSVSSSSEVQTLTTTVSFSGEDELEACLDAAGSPAALAECETAYGAFRLSFTPTLAGKLRLTFAVQNDVLLDSSTGLPFQALVSPGPAALDTSTLYGSALDGCVGGAGCTLFIRLADQYGNALNRPGLLGVEQSLSLSYELEGSGAGPPAVAMASIQQIVTDLATGVQRVEFTPPSFQAGDYLMKMSVRLVSNIPGSTADSGLLDELLILVYRTNAPLQASSSGLLNREGRPVSPGTSIGSFPSGSVTVLQVQLRDRNGVDFVDFVGAEFLRADLQPQVEDLIIVEDGPGLISVRFTPSISGTYSLTLTDSDGAPVGGSSGSSGSAGQYELTVAPAFPSSPAMSRLELVSDGRLGEAVPSLSATAGVAFTVQIQAVDAYGNLQTYSVEVGPEPFEVQLRRRTDPGEEEAAPPRSCVVYDNNDGTYSAVCMGTVSGDYDLEAGLRDEDGVVPLGEGAPGDPPVLVSMGHGEVFAPESTFDPPASALLALSLAAGSPFEFTVQARDTYGNLHTSGGLAFALEVEVEDGAGGGDEEDWVTVLAEVEGRVTVAEGGLYTARLTPVRSGRHRITVRERTSGLIVDQSFMVYVEPGSAEAQLVEATGGGLAGGTAGMAMRFTLALRDAYGNLVAGQAEEITLTSTPVSQADGTATTARTPSVLINETAPGLLSVQYNLSSVGEHDVEVLLGSTRIPGSPFRVVVSPRPSPIITSATFDANLGSLTVDFNGATNRGGARYAAAVAATGPDSEGTCDALLPSALLAKLGGDPSCTWVTDASLRVFFGRGATLLPTERSVEGDTFRMAPNRVYNKAGNSYSVVSSVSIGLPEGPVVSPSASLAGPTTLGVCANLVLDATASSGGSGRPLHLAFSAFAADGQSTKVTQQLAEAVATAESESPGLVTLPSAALDPGRRYTFRVAATNFLGSSSIAELGVLKSALPLPQVAILGTAVRRVRRSVDTVVSASAAAPDISCLESAGSLGGSRIVFSWEQVDGASIVESDFPTPNAFAKYTASLATRYLHLPADTLGVAVRPDGTLRSYSFRLTAAMEADPVLAASAEVELLVEPDPISARIQGGSSIALPEGAALQLEIAASDPSEAVHTEGVPTPFIFLWSCEAMGGGGCFPANHPGNTVLVTAETVLTLPADSLAVGEYIFSVEVTREPITPTRRVVTSATVAVGAGVGALSAGPSEQGGVIVVGPPGTPSPTPPTGGEEGEEGEGEDDEPAWVLGIAAPLEAEVSPAQRLVLQGVITPPPDAEGGGGGVTLLWSCVEGDLSDTGALADAADNALNENYLSLPPGSLTPGQLYRFRLTGGGVAGGAVAEVSIQVAASPWGGVLEVSSAAGTNGAGRPAGTELLTRFVLRARDWTNSAGVVDYTYVPNIDALLESAGMDPSDWLLLSDITLVLEAERYLGRAPSGSVSLEAILPEGLHLVIAYISSPDGATVRTVFQELFELAPPPTLRRALAQQQLLATQARRAVNLGLQPALDTGDRIIAQQFLDIYTGRYAGDAPADPLSNCELSPLEDVTREVTEVALELQAQALRYDLRASQDVCTLSALVSDPTATDVDTASAVLETLVELLSDEELALTPRALRCSAQLLSATIVNAESVCRTSGGREQSLLDRVRSVVAIFAEAASRDLRAGMPPLVFDTAQLTVEVAAHSAGRAVGEAVGLVGGRPGIPPSATYDISFAQPASTVGVSLLWPSPSTPSLEVRSALTFTATVSLLPTESEDERLASLPATLQLWAIRVAPSSASYSTAELPEMTTARLTRAPVIRSTDGFSPALYAWRGADWGPIGGTALMEGDAAWGVALDGPLPLGLEPAQGDSVTFGVWLRDQLSPPTSPPPPPNPSPPPPAPTPVVIVDSDGVPSWVYWAVPIVALSLLLLIIGLVLICRRRLRSNRHQTLHPAEKDEGGEVLYSPPNAPGAGGAASPGDTPRSGTPLSSSGGSESRALMATNNANALTTTLSGAEQAARDAANAPGFARALHDESESDAGTDIGSSDDEIGEAEAMAYTVHDPFRNAPPTQTYHPAQPAVPVPTGHFQTIGGSPPTSSSTQRQALFDTRRPGRSNAAERMRSGAVQPGAAPRASARLDAEDARTINRDHWTGRAGAGRTRPGDGGKY